MCNFEKRINDGVIGHRNGGRGERVKGSEAHLTPARSLPFPLVGLLLVLLGLGLAARAPGQVAGAVGRAFSLARGSFPALRIVALQKDGRILVGGLFSSVNGLSRRNLVRLNADGSADETFVDPQLNGRAFALGIKPDGKVLLGGNFFFVGGAGRNN